MKAGRPKDRPTSSYEYLCRALLYRAARDVLSSHSAHLRAPDLYFEFPDIDVPKIMDGQSFCNDFGVFTGQREEFEDVVGKTYWSLMVDEPREALRFAMEISGKGLQGKGVDYFIKDWAAREGYVKKYGERVKGGLGRKDKKGWGKKRKKKSKTAEESERVEPRGAYVYDHRSINLESDRLEDSDFSGGLRGRRPGA